MGSFFTTEPLKMESGVHFSIDVVADYYKLGSLESNTLIFSIMWVGV